MARRVSPWHDHRAMPRRIASLYRRAYSGLPREVWLLSIITLVHRSGTMVLPFLALYLTQKLGLSAETAGLVLALYGVGAIAGAQLGGWLADRIGPLHAQTLSFVAAGIALLALGFVERRGWLELTVVVASLSAESHRPANASAIAAFTDAGNRFRAFAMRRMAVNLGMTVGPAIGGFLAAVDYLYLFLCNGLACLVAAVLMVWVLRRGHLVLDAPRHSPGKRKDIAATSRRRSPWRDGLYLRFLLMVTLSGTLFLQLLGAYPLTLHEKLGHPEQVIGLIFAVNTALIVIFEMVLIESVGRWAPLKVVAFGSLFLAAGFGLLPWVTDLPTLVFTVLLWTWGEMLTHPLCEGVAANMAPEENRGAYLGLYTATFSTALVLAPLSGNWVYQNLGWRPLWWGCGALFVLSAVAFWHLSKRIDTTTGVQSDTIST